MECYACENEATRQCRRCARVYCELHGGELCGECLSPASALPSLNLYRGSLLVLLVGTAIALWLLVRPPGPGESDEVVVVGITPTVAATSAPTDDATATPRGTTTPDATPRATPTSEPTEPQPQEYVVQEGDTLASIAERFAPPGVTPYPDFAEQIAAANGMTLEDSLTPGQTLIIPAE